MQLVTLCYIIDSSDSIKPLIHALLLVQREEEALVDVFHERLTRLAGQTDTAFKIVQTHF